MVMIFCASVLRTIQILPRRQVTVPEEGAPAHLLEVAPQVVVLQAGYPEEDRQVDSQEAVLLVEAHLEADYPGEALLGESRQVECLEASLLAGLRAVHPGVPLEGYPQGQEE